MKQIIAILMVFAPLMVWAQDVIEGASEQVYAPDSVAAAIEFLPVIIEAFKNGQWLMFGALVSLVVTFLVRKYALPKLKLGKGWLPVVSAIVGVLAGVGLAVANGAELMPASLAVLSGPVASTLWSSLLKVFFKKD